MFLGRFSFYNKLIGTLVAALSPNPVSLSRGQSAELDYSRQLSLQMVRRTIFSSTADTKTGHFIECLAKLHTLAHFIFPKTYGGDIISRPSLYKKKLWLNKIKTYTMQSLSVRNMTLMEIIL